MALPNIFTKEVSENIISRINNLNYQTQPQWGKMSVEKMLAHCNVTYEYIYENKYAKPTFMQSILLKLVVKPLVTNEKPYKRNNPTGPDFIIADERVFDTEKNRLVHFIRKTQEMGEAHFDGKESHSFGVLNKNQWNNMLYKHLDHHLTQFGA